MQLRALEIRQQLLDDRVAPARDFGVERAAHVAHHADGDVAHLVLLVVLQPDVDEREKRVHVLLEVFAAGVRERAHAQHRLLVHRARARAEHAEERLHDLVGILAHERVLRLDARGRHLLHDGLQRAAQQALGLAQLLLLLRGRARLRERVQGRAELLHDHRDEVLHHRRRLGGGRADDLVEALKRLHAQAKLGVATLGRHQQRLHGALEVGRERRAHGVRVVLAAAGHREPLQRPARLAGDEGLVLKRGDQRGEDLVQVRRRHHRGRGSAHELEHAPDGPRGRVAHVRVAVLGGGEQERERLRRHRRELISVGSFQDAAEGERRRLAQAPLGLVGDVGGDERHHRVNHRVFDARRDETQAGPAGHRDVPRVVAILHLVLVLLGERLQEHGH